MLTSIQDSLRTLQTRPSKERRLRVLSALSNTIVYVPVHRVENVIGSVDEKKVKIVTENRGEDKELSVFTEEDKFFEWSGDHPYQCFSVAAGDLALTLPNNTWIVLDPGSEHEQVFSPEEVDYLAYPIAESEMQIASAEFEEDLGFVEKELPAPHTEELSQTEKASMREEIRETLSKYLSVDEGYLVDLSGQAVVGILGEEMASEERFSLIENLAEISRKYFGEAGAIEVYDDLHSPVSTSWEMFSAQAPFFVRSADEAAPMHKRDDLLHSDAEYPEEDEADLEKGSLWQRLRKRYRF